MFEFPFLDRCTQAAAINNKTRRYMTSRIRNIQTPTLSTTSTYTVQSSDTQPHSATIYHEWQGAVSVWLTLRISWSDK